MGSFLPVALSIPDGRQRLRDGLAPHYTPRHHHRRTFHYTPHAPHTYLPTAWLPSPTCTAAPPTTRTIHRAAPPLCRTPPAPPWAAAFACYHGMALPLPLLSRCLAPPAGAWRRAAPGPHCLCHTHTTRAALHTHYRTRTPHPRTWVGLTGSAPTHV